MTDNILVIKNTLVNIQIWLIIFWSWKDTVLNVKKKYVLPTLQLTIIGKEHEMTSNVLTNAGKHVTLNTACARNQWDTRDYKPSDWPKWPCVLWCKVISGLLDQTSFQTVRKTADNILSNFSGFNDLTRPLNWVKDDALWKIR